MSMMSSMDILCSDVYERAASALQSGEKMSDVSQSIFDQIFNIAGGTADAKEWAISTASGIASRLAAETEKAEQLSLRAPELREQLAIALDLMFDYQEIEKMYPEELKRIEDLLRDTE